MMALDLFCGRGGWTKGLLAEGFEVIGVDIVNRNYPGNLILQDVRTVDGRRFKDFDLIIGSPPCTEFSIAKWWRAKTLRHPPQPEKGVELVNHFKRVVAEAEPRMWIMENVPNAVKWLGKPTAYIRYCDFGYPARTRRALWGIIPLLYSNPVQPTLPDIPYRFPRHDDITGERSEIPFPIAKAVASAVKRELTG